MIARIYHHHERWEDYAAGQYALRYADKTVGIESSAWLLSEPVELYAAMSAVCREWPNASEHNLTNREQNRQAWLGQAACCFKFGVPDFVVKSAWHTLTEAQQQAANAVADQVMNEWEASRAETLFRH